MKTTSLFGNPISDATFFSSQIALILTILMSFLCYPLFGLPSNDLYVLITGTTALLCCAGLITGYLLYNHQTTKIQKVIQLLMLGTLFMTSLLMLISEGRMDPVEALLAVLPASLIFLSIVLGHLDTVLRIKKGLALRTNAREITLTTLLISVIIAVGFSMIRGGLFELPIPYLLLGILIYTLVFFIAILPFKALTLVGCTIGGR